MAKNFLSKGEVALSAKLKGQTDFEEGLKRLLLSCPSTNQPVYVKVQNALAVVTTVGMAA